jgi:hypothetical protein
MHWAGVLGCFGSGGIFSIVLIGWDGWVGSLVGVFEGRFGAWTEDKYVTTSIMSIIILNCCWAFG